MPAGGEELPAPAWAVAAGAEERARQARAGGGGGGDGGGGGAGEEEGDEMDFLPSQFQASQKPPDLVAEAEELKKKTGQVLLRVPEKLSRSRVLLEYQVQEGRATDLSGDTGAVGRVLVSQAPDGRPRLGVDLKGILYRGEVVPTMSLAVVTVGQEEARLDALMSSVVRLHPEADQGEVLEEAGGIELRGAGGEEVGAPVRGGSTVMFRDAAGVPAYVSVETAPKAGAKARAKAGAGAPARPRPAQAQAKAKGGKKKGPSEGKKRAPWESGSEEEEEEEESSEEAGSEEDGGEEEGSEGEEGSSEDEDSGSSDWKPSKGGGGGAATKRGGRGAQPKRGGQSRAGTAKKARR